MALVDMVDGYASTRRNIGEYIKEKPDLLPPGRRSVWHDLKWGRGLPDIIKGVEHSLECLQRRGTSRPAIIVISYAGNDIFGNYGFLHCDWLDKEMACYSQKRRDAANDLMEERVNTHFSALNDLVKLTTRADVGNIVLVMPWYGRGYGLHPDFDRQMIREAEALRKRGLCVLDATSLIKCTTRYDGQHMENSEHNRLQCIRFYSEAGALGYHLFRLRSCKPLIEMAEMKKRREESLANPLPENNPEWEEMEEVLVSMDVDGWEIYVKETRPKGQRLPNEVDPERAQLQQAPVVQDDAAVASSNWQLLESVDVALPGEPEHFDHMRSKSRRWMVSSLTPSSSPFWIGCQVFPTSATLTSRMLTRRLSLGIPLSAARHRAALPSDEQDPRCGLQIGWLWRSEHLGHRTSHVILPSLNFGRSPCSRQRMVQSSFVDLT